MAMAGKQPGLLQGFGQSLSAAPGNLLQNVQTPDFWNWISGVGAALDRSARGGGFDLSQANQGLMQGIQGRKAGEQMQGLMQGMNLNPQQQQFLGTLSRLNPEKAMEFTGQQLFAQPAGPQSSIAKLVADYRSGQIDEPTFKAALAKATNVNPLVNVNTGSTMPQVGTIPQGYELRQTETGWQMAPIEGGPAAEKIQQGQEAQAKAAETTARAGGVVLEDIGRVKKKIQESTLPVTGLVGSWLQKIPGTNAYDVSALTKTVTANIGFDRLQQMREASPTGGALGSVSDREVSTLQAVLGSLDQSQSEDQLMQNLDRLEKIYTDIMTKVAAYPNAAAYGFGGAPAPTAPEAEKTLNGKRYIKRNGKWFEAQ